MKAHNRNSTMLRWDPDVRFEAKDFGDTVILKVFSGAESELSIADLFMSQDQILALDAVVSEAARVIHNERQAEEEEARQEALEEAERDEADDMMSEAERLGRPTGSRI